MEEIVVNKRKRKNRQESRIRADRPQGIANRNRQEDNIAGKQDFLCDDRRHDKHKRRHNEMPNPVRYRIFIEHVELTKDRVVRMKVLTYNACVLNMGGSILRREILKAQNWNEVEYYQHSKEDVITIA